MGHFEKCQTEVKVCSNSPSALLLTICKFESIDSTLSARKVKVEIGCIKVINLVVENEN